MGKRLIVALVVISAVMPGVAAAQDSPQTVVELTLRDGSRLYGSMDEERSDEIVFRTIGGALVTVRRDDIGALKVVRGAVVADEFLPEDPNRTRLFFGPTGRSLPRGQTYLGVYEVTMPFVQVGVTDRFSIGGGTPLGFGLGESERPFWVTPKLQILDDGRTSAAAGVIHLVSEGHHGIAYGVLTFSAAAGSVTAGAGMAYSDDGGRAPVVMIGADRRVRRNLKVMTENYVWEGGGAIVAGVRFISDRLSADLGLAVPLNIGGFLAAPVVNFVYVF